MFFEQGKRLGLWQAAYRAAIGLLKSSNAGSEQQVEVAAAAQTQVVGLQVSQFVGVVHHKQAGLWQAGHGREQDIKTLPGIRSGVKLQSQRRSQLQQGISDAALAKHPADIRVLALIGVVIPGRQRGLSHAAGTVDEQQQIIARAEQPVVDAL